MPSICTRSTPSQSYHWICEISLTNSANLIWFNPPYVCGETQSVFSKPFSWPDTSENTKEQNFSQDQTETNLFKSSVLLEYLKQAMINLVMKKNVGGHCWINTSKIWYKLYLLSVTFAYCQSPCREDVFNRPYIFFMCQIDGNLTQSSVM